MNNPFANFLLGFLCTCGLFVVCLFLVVGGKMVFLSIKERLFSTTAENSPAPPKSPVIKRQKRKPSAPPKPVRSIEIDPEQVDRIYVKKTG